jgi:hypothetical protein
MASSHSAVRWQSTSSDISREAEKCSFVWRQYQATTGGEGRSRVHEFVTALKLFALKNYKSSINPVTKPMGSH